MFTIKPITDFDEFLAARRLMGLVFRGHTDHGPIEEQRHHAQIHMTMPGFTLEQHRIGLLDGEIVAHVLANPFKLRYGNVTLQLGGIGAVCTHPDHRKMGYAAAVMQDTFDYMLARGDHFALLGTGEVDFYTKFGYHTVWPDQSLEVQAAVAAAITAPLTLRAATVDDLPQIMALFERQWGSRITLERPAELWRWRMENDYRMPIEVVEDRAGRIVGYHAGAEWTSEWVADNTDAALTLLASAGKAAVNSGAETVEWYLPATDRIVYDVSRHVNCKMRIDYEPGSQWMGRIVDAEGFRDILLPEITRQAGLDERGFIFSIQSDSVYIGLRGQDETNVQLQHSDFLRMLFGALPPMVLNLPDEATHLLEALFPPRTALVAPWSFF